MNVIWIVVDPNEAERQNGSLEQWLVALVGKETNKRIITMHALDSDSENICETITETLKSSMLSKLVAETYGVSELSGANNDGDLKVRLAQQLRECVSCKGNTVLMIPAKENYAVIKNLVDNYNKNGLPVAKAKAEATH